MAVLFAGTILSIAAPARAADQVLVDRKDACQVSVPADWKTDPVLKGSAHSPDKQGSVVISSTNAGQSLADAKKVVSSTFPPVTVLDDSANRYWYEYRPAGGRGRAWYVGIPVKGNVCGAQITMKDGNEAVAKAIATSISAKK
jgi:hypothetical protein